MDINHKLWNQEHQKLRRALSSNDPQKAIAVFLDLHARVHSAKLVLSEAEGMSRSKLWSFEDEVLNDLTEDQVRCILPNAEHSIAWILFHLARIEDITMTMLVAGMSQLLLRENWAKKLHVDVLHSANEMDDRSVAALSAQINIDSLKAYRLAVGRATRAIVKKLNSKELGRKPVPSRLQKVMEQGALLPEATGILNYWSGRTIAGLLLMSPTRHNFLHLNEALRIKRSIYKRK